MRNALKFIFIGLVAQLYGCNNETTEEKRIQVNDSTYIIQKYNKGVLISEKNIMKSIYGEGGVFKEYYQNGKISKMGYFFNDKPDGTQIEFDKNGNERFISMIFSDQTVRFRMKLDENGRVISQHGTPLHIYHKGNPIKINEAVDFVYAIVVTDNLKTKLSIRTINPEGVETYNKIFSDFIPQKKEAHLDRIQFRTAGDFINIVDVELRNKNGMLLAEGRIVDTITVVN